MEFTEIDHGKTFDFGKTAAFYASYRDIYPAQLYTKLRALGVAADGTHWLDLGTGTGVLPKNLYNENARITAADISREQIAFAKKEAEENGLDIRYICAPAENTGLPEGSFDAVTAAKCFFYFDRDKMQTEIRRLLKPGGMFIKIFMTWKETDPVASFSQALVRRMNPQWTSADAALRDITDDLFPGRATERFTAELPFTRESWHGRMCACRGTLAAMDEKTFGAWEEAHKKYLSGLPERFTVEHEVIISRFVL